MVVEAIHWKKLRDGDLDAFSRIYKSYYQFLFSSGYRESGDVELTKDCIHELFTELWHKRTDLPAVQHVGPYLRIILQRKLAREQARLRPATFITEQEPAIQLSYEDLLIGLQDKQEVRDRIRKALESLSPAQLEIIRLRFFEELSYDEIARFTGKAPRTIYNQVFTALQILRKSLHLFFVSMLLSFFLQK